MATEQQLQTLDKYIDTIHELLIDQVTGAWCDSVRQVTQNRIIFVRMLGQILYEAPRLHTGMVSIDLVEQKLNDFSIRPCHEHHHSRQKGGAALLALAERAIKTGGLPIREDVRAIVMKHCQVHYTTVDENNLLRKHQRRCSSEAAYRRSSIQLIHAPELFSKRGHSAKWKREMTAKYQPIVQSYKNPDVQQQDTIWPEVIH